MFTPAEFSALQTPVARVFSKLRRDYCQYKNANDDLYGDDVLNIRFKLTNQKFTSGKYLVLYGAGGSNVASAYLPLSEDNADIVVDQTLYYLVVNSEDEAVFITGLLNSDVLSEAITIYQPSGRFGERHIHTLPKYFIPQYDSNNSNHTDFVSATRAVISELTTKISTDNTIRQLTDPNYSVLASKRRRLMNTIQSLNSFAEYDRLSRLIIV